MNIWVLFVAFVALTVPPFVEAARARRRLDDTLVARGALPPRRKDPITWTSIASWRPTPPIGDWGPGSEQWVRSVERDRLGRDLPEGRAAKRWTVTSFLVWILALPILLLVIPTIDDLVSGVVPGASNLWMLVMAGTGLVLWLVIRRPR